MIIQSPGEIAFSISGFSVYWYGIILALAVLAGVFCAELISKKYSDIPKNFFIDNSPIVIIFGIIGARLYYCAVNFSYYINKPFEVFDIRQGGLSIHGMLIAGAVIVYFLSKKYKICFLRLADILACSTILAQAIGRWGNFFNSEAFGLPVKSSSWGLFIPASHRPLQYMEEELFHPTFLYESVLDLIIFFILIRMQRTPHKNGTVLCMYLILYSAARIIIEQIRIDSVLNILGVPVAQLISVIIILFSLLLFYKTLRSTD